jgi:hypothetical protein
VPLSSAERVWIALAALAMLATGGVEAYLYFAGRAASKETSEPGTPIYAASPAQAQRTLSVLAELPGDAPAVAYIDVESLRKLHASPLAGLLGLTGGKSPEDREYQQFVRETGFDYTRDLDRAAVAFWPDGLGEARAGATEDNRAFIVADGRFDEGKIRAYALKAGKVHVSGTENIYEIPGEPAVSFEFLSPRRIAIASGGRSTEFLVSSRSTARDPAFQTRIDRVAGASLFAVARTDSLPKSFYKNFHNSPQIEDLAQSVRSLTLAAQPEGDILKVVLDGESTSAKNALAITTVLEISRMGASAALSGPTTSGQFTNEQDVFLDALIRKSTISHQDRWVRLAFDITPSMLGGGNRTPPAHKAAGSPQE